MKSKHSGQGNVRHPQAPLLVWGGYVELHVFLSVLVVPSAQWDLLLATAHQNDIPKAPAPRANGLPPVSWPKKCKNCACNRVKMTYQKCHLLGQGHFSAVGVQKKIVKITRKTLNSKRAQGMVRLGTRDFAHGANVAKPIKLQLQLVIE